MEFNVSTFVLEVINFLVLIWILQRLFYKPLLGVIAKRKDFISQALADAENLKLQAETLRHDYENRLKSWELEKQSAIHTLQAQLSIEKSTQMQRFQDELEQVRQSAKATQAFQQQQWEQQLERQALQNAARFAALLLQRAVTPELEGQLCQLLLEQWSSLPEACHASFKNLKLKEALPVKISSAFPLAENVRDSLQHRLETLVTQPIRLSFAIEPEIIAGLRIDLGAWVLNANLQHELIGFAELVDASQFH